MFLLQRNKTLIDILASEGRCSVNRLVLQRQWGLQYLPSFLQGQRTR